MGLAFPEGGELEIDDRHQARDKSKLHDVGRQTLHLVDPVSSADGAESDLDNKPGVVISSADTVTEGILEQVDDAMARYDAAVAEADSNPGNEAAEKKLLDAIAALEELTLEFNLATGDRTYAATPNTTSSSKTTKRWLGPTLSGGGFTTPHY